MRKLAASSSRALSAKMWRGGQKTLLALGAMGQRWGNPSAHAGCQERDSGIYAQDTVYTWGLYDLGRLG